MEGGRTGKIRSPFVRREKPSDLGSGLEDGGVVEPADSRTLSSITPEGESGESVAVDVDPDTEGESEAVSPALPSFEPVAVGRPTVVFEPKPIGSSYHSSPYRSDTVMDGWSNDFFAVRASSVRGYLHRYNGAPRQDDFALLLRADGRQLLIAVADGVSGAEQSHIGSTTAVRYAIRWLDANLPEEVSDGDWRALAENTAWALVEQANALFGVDKSAEEAEQLLATTLVCAVVDYDEDGGATAHVVGVGDSGAWILSEGSITRIEGGKEESDAGLASSAVSGLPRVPDEVRAVTTRIKAGEVLLLGTDGFGDPLGPGTGDLGSLFKTLLGDSVPSMIAFTYALDFSRETFDDDRTLVAVWPGPHSNDPSP